MKKALVYTQAVEGRTIGQVGMVMEASQMDAWTHHHLQFAEKVEVPANLENIPESYLEGVLVAVVPESWTDGTNTVTTQPMIDDGSGNMIPDPAYTYVPAVPEHWEIQATASYFDLAKTQKISEVDAKTASLIAQGAVYDNQTFSLSLNAQTNWAALKTLEAILAWPVKISTIDDNEYILTQANLDAFLGVVSATVQGHLDSGRALKISINAATNQAEIDAIVDNR